MRFDRTTIDGVLEVVLERQVDERGSFSRTFCTKEFAAAGLPVSFVQANTSVSRLAGTMRGMHYQRAPHGEGKLVRCLRGAVLDVVADLRHDSPTRGTWQAFELSEDGDSSIYVPPGCAHGFLTLADDSEVTYLMSEFYAPGYAAGFRYDDPAFAIEWPAPVTVISAKDEAWQPHDWERDVYRVG